MRITKKTLERSRKVADRAVGGVALIIAHELNAISGHWAEARERIAVARKARGVAELLRDQYDLLPETRARLELDHRERRSLLGDLFRNLGAGGQLAA